MLLIEGGEGSADGSTGIGAARYAVRLIGGFQLTRDGLPYPLPWGSQRVLAFLALRDAFLDRAYIAFTLWPELAEERARANLRTALWKMRIEACSPVESNGRALGLAASVFVDLHAARVVARRLMEEPARASLTDCRDRSLHEDLLPDWYDDWVAFERERYLHMRLHALEAACLRLTQLGMHGEAVLAGVSATHAEPLRESAHRVLIGAHVAEGNVECAIRQFERFRDALDRELGAEPSEHMGAMMRSVGAFGARRATLAEAR